MGLLIAAGFTFCGSFTAFLNGFVDGHLRVKK